MAQPELPDWCLERDAWPTTVEDAVLDILTWIGPEGRARLLALSESDLSLLHFGLAMGIRNRHGLWRGNQALLQAALNGSRWLDVDEASNAIAKRAWSTLQRWHRRAERRRARR